jgi:hypothetical protein
MPPDAYLPKIGPTYPRAINFLAASNDPTNDSGRYINRGLEGLSLSPSGKRLVACFSLRSSRTDRTAIRVATRFGQLRIAHV